MPNSPPTVLVLDDLPDAAEAIAAWLTLEGWRAICALTVEQALTCLTQEQIDAVVMEPYLRSGSAQIVATAARTGPRHPLMVSVSASARSGDPTSYEPTLFDFNLTKPVSMVVLSELLDLHRRRDSNW